MPYKAIFEIGPIFDYIQSTRKTKDLWGGSFLFSYLMGFAAKLILENELGEQNLNKDEIEKNLNSIILRPNLLKNNLFYKICGIGNSEKIDAGSIPDQFFCELGKLETPQNVKNGIQKELEKLFLQCHCILLQNYQRVNSIPDSSIVIKQLQNYFRFFYVKADQNCEQDILKNAVATRGEIFEIANFQDEQKTPHSKKNKCSLCGDRAKVITLIKSKRNDKDEHLCAICTIKRGLLDQFDEWINIERFQSTTAIAATTAREIMRTHFTDLTTELSAFKKAHDTSQEARDDLNKKQMDELKNLPVDEKIIPKLSYQYYFSDEEIAQKFRKKIKNLADKDKKLWVDHPYFAIIALDGDDTGNLMTVSEKNKKLDEFSKTVNNYTQKTAEIINRFGGQLIFCGGEDTLAIVHPQFLLDVVKQLNLLFRESFENEKKLHDILISQDSIKERIKKGLHSYSISAGAIICNHKYPLSLAIKTAHDMLDNHAKKEDKAALAVRLIKGGSGRCDFICKIDEENIYDLEDFRELIGCKIPRGFVYKLIDEKEIFSKTLNNRQDIKDYLFFLFDKTRSKFTKEEKEKVKKVLSKFVQIYDESKTDDKEKEKEFNKIINYLYFARFLEGGE